MAAQKGHKKAGGRQKGTPNAATVVKKALTQQYFGRILNDKLEDKLWKKFILGTEPNAVNWQAFKRAVEYKRGMPIQQVEASGADGKPVELIVRTVGERAKP